MALGYTTVVPFYLGYYANDEEDILPVGENYSSNLVMEWLSRLHIFIVTQAEYSKQAEHLD